MPLTKVDPKMFGGGAVLQVVSNVLTTNSSLTATFASTGLSATITPSSVNSKILVVITQPFAIVTSSGATAWGAIGIYRGATTIFEPRNTGSGGTQLGTDGFPVAQHQFRGVFTASILDSPNTTSPVTYETKASALSATITTPGSEATQTSAHIQLMEIAG